MVPLLPAYLATVSGVSAADLGDDARRRRRLWMSGPTARRPTAQPPIP
ncbi:MAG: hypothetical protein E6J45_10650 [Chloroflexi bacterium]|nr:MAG: hypothetical protein E6J45_10650 [Chloroflexota bacterium]